MPLPEEFSEWEHLQHTLKKVHNSAVKEFYSEQPDNDIGTSRAAAKHACLIKDEDTANMVMIRFWMFWVICRKMRDNFPPFFSAPVAQVDSEIRYKPQITCYFLEDWNDVEQGYSPIDGQLSVRLIKETSNTISQSELNSLANKVNLAFGQQNGFVWKKGKILYSYVDKAKGHRFKALVRKELDATEIFKKQLSLVGDPYEPARLKLNQSPNAELTYPIVPPNHTILGQTYKEPRKRPVAEVKFQYASIKLWGLPNPIILVDKTGYFPTAIIPAY